LENVRGDMMIPRSENGAPKNRGTVRGAGKGEERIRIDGGLRRDLGYR